VRGFDPVRQHCRLPTITPTLAAIPAIRQGRKYGSAFVGHLDRPDWITERASSKAVSPTTSNQVKMGICRLPQVRYHDIEPYPFGGARDMPNILIRDLSQEAVDHIDTAASNLGLSRNEYLRRKFEQAVTQPVERTVTAEDWRRSAETFADLADPDLMGAAWR
jgi:hypothetical protein